MAVVSPRLAGGLVAERKADGNRGEKMGTGRRVNQFCDAIIKHSAICHIN